MTSEFSQHWQKIAFIAALCTRHQANFSLFCEALEQPDQAKTYGKVLNKVWEYLAEQLTSIKNLEKALLQLEEITPEPADYDYYGAYPASDACVLLTSALQMIIDDSIDDLDDARHLSKATVAQFLAVSEDLEEDSEEVAAHQLFVEELAFQKGLESRLVNATDSRPAQIKQLRRDLGDFESSNIGIPIE